MALAVDGQLTRRYVYGAGLFPRARLDAAGDVIERYVYASREHVPDLIVRRDGTRLRLITDTLGSVRAVVDADTGAVVQRLAYSAYGQVTQDTNPGVQPFGFKGALSDPAAEGAGLVWMGVRAYIPTLARFATPEPLGIAVAWNEHDALAGDPINLADARGMWPDVAGWVDEAAGTLTPWAAGVAAVSGAVAGGCAALAIAPCAGVAGAIALGAGGVALAGNTWLAARGKAPWTAPLTDLLGLGFGASRFLPDGIVDDLIEPWGDVYGGLFGSAMYGLGEFWKWVEGDDDAFGPCPAGSW